eukprot:TRINITY_DN5939_c9_g1_i1.p1 TRINITY_DN5939_c9_g1~~TRINITY_DN5939_c9_g1_i1.p1  ORF type:complete len:349 (+),score=85.00 TRINITY_DN5939_c9_g1_i1:51-1097(+)
MNYLRSFFKSAHPEFSNSSKSFKQNKDSNESNQSRLDLVFAMDCTASMGSYIGSATESIQNIVNVVASHQETDVRFGYVAYRDHPPQDSSFVTQCHDFMKTPAQMKGAIATFGAEGGGDGPEAVTAALNEAMQYPWREDAVKIVVLVADAPPHGIGCSGDGFPKGDPNNLDPIEIAHKMAAQGIILYVVACEPSLSNYANAHDVMEGLATITEGKYLPLTAAHLLPDVIIAGAKEELALQKLEDYMYENVKKMKEENLDRGDIEKKMEELMKEKPVTTEQMELTDIYNGYDRTNIEAISKCSNLAEAAGNITTLAQPEIQLQEQRVMMECKAAPSSKMMSRMSKKCMY